MEDDDKGQHANVARQTGNEAPGSQKRLSLDLNRMAEGELAPGGDFLTTARAHNEVAITVRGDSHITAKRILQLHPDNLGNDKVLAAWRPQSSQLAVAFEKVSRSCLGAHLHGCFSEPCLHQFLRVHIPLE